jgi:hypothetical protein
MAVAGYAGGANIQRLQNPAAGFCDGRKAGKDFRCNLPFSSVLSVSSVVKFLIKPKQ